MGHRTKRGAGPRVRVKHRVSKVRVRFRGYLLGCLLSDR